MTSHLCIQMFAPVQDVESFAISHKPEEGRDKCPYGPATGYTALITGKPFKMPGHVCKHFTR